MNSKCTESESWQIAQRRSEETRSAKAIKRREEYNSNPKLCEHCNNPIPYENRKGKFCSHSCSANVSNRGRARIRHCICGARLHWRNAKYCTRDCCLKHQRESFDSSILGNSKVSSGTLRRYILRTREHKCAICSLMEWQGKPIPLDVDHIDGNPDNNLDENIRLLCKNCHAQTPTYGAKNKGKGRAKRRQVYERLGYS